MFFLRIIVFCFLITLCACTNTMVKFYEFSDSDWKTQTDKYEIELNMQAFIIGNIMGVDSFEVVIKVTAQETISPSLERSKVPLLRIDSLRLILPETGEVLIPELKPWNFDDVHLKSSIFENRLCDRIETKPLNIPDERDTLELYFDLVFFDRSTMEEKKRESVSKQIIRKAAMRKYGDY
jgi:hypothetical protein